MFYDFYIIFIVALLVILIIAIIRLSVISKNQKITDIKLDIILSRLNKLNQRLEEVQQANTPIAKSKTCNIDDTLALKAEEEEESTEHTKGLQDTHTIPTVEESELPPPLIHPEAAIQTPKSEPIEAVTKPNDLFEQLNKLFCKLFGGNILAKIGIITLVLGVGFFVKYAIDQDWINEVGRIGVGLLVGALIIGVGHKLKEEFNIFSSILVGGGLAIFYVTITLGFREYAVFSQNIAFVLLILITILSVFFALLYNRQELAIFSLIGGFISPILVSTGNSNYVVLFSYLLILNTGMIVLSLKKGWKAITILAFACTAIFFTSWVARVSTEMIVEKIVFAKLFFLQFYITVVFKHLNENKGLTKFQLFLFITNNLMAILASQYILVNEYAYLKGVSILILAFFNFAVMIVLYSRGEKHKIDISNNFIYLMLGVVLSLVSLAIPIQLSGVTITIFWATEAVLLLWLWKKIRVQVVNIASVVMLLLTFVSLFIDYAKFYSLTVEETIIFNPLCITGLSVILALLIYRWLLQSVQEDKAIFSFRGFILSWNTLRTVLDVSLAVLIFVVPMLEINKQLYFHWYGLTYPSFRYTMLLCYTSLYLGSMAWMVRHKLNKGIVTILYLSSALLIYMSLSTSSTLIFQTYKHELFNRGMHGLQLLFLVGMLPTLYVIYKYISQQAKHKMWYLSILLVLVVALFSLELKQVVMMFCATGDNYISIQMDVDNFGYPILWAIIALTLLVWGIRSNLLENRKLALIFFGLIILKFYLIDVWTMSQTGRIISFIALGVILLVGSFLQQKIKTWATNNSSISEANQTPNGTLNKEKEES